MLEDAQRRRSTWTTDTIRASDIDDHDTVLIDGIWREVFDVWRDAKAAAAQFGDDHKLTRKIKEKIAWESPCWIAVRYVHEEKSSSSDVESGLAFFRLRELVQVQREVRPQASTDLVVERDPDGDTDLVFFHGGKRVIAADLGIRVVHIDPGAGDTDEAWVQEMAEKAAKCSEAAAEYINGTVELYAGRKF